jgi:hypothetical protein
MTQKGYLMWKWTYRTDIRNLALSLIGFHLNFYYRKHPQCDSGQFRGPEMWRAFAPDAYAIIRLCKKFYRKSTSSTMQWAEDLIERPPFNVKDYVANTHMHQNDNRYPKIYVENMSEVKSLERRR